MIRLRARARWRFSTLRLLGFVTVTFPSGLPCNGNQNLADQGEQIGSFGATLSRVDRTVSIVGNIDVTSVVVEVISRYSPGKAAASRLAMKPGSLCGDAAAVEVDPVKIIRCRTS